MIWPGIILVESHLTEDPRAVDGLFESLVDHVIRSYHSDCLVQC